MFFKSWLKRKLQVGGTYDRANSCIRCGKLYVVTNLEKRFLKEKDLGEPLCCRQCQKEATPDVISETNYPHVMPTGR